MYLSLPLLVRYIAVGDAVPELGNSLKHASSQRFGEILTKPGLAPKRVFFCAKIVMNVY